MTPHDRQFIEYTPFNTSNVSLDKIINTISSESLFLYVLCAVKAKQGLSVIRMGDGEAGFMNYYINGIKPRWLSHNWLDYMCIRDHSDDNIKRIGKELIEVASDADFFGGNLWGLTNSAFDLWKFIERDKCNCSAFFPLEWYANGCMHSLLMTCSFGLLHKEPENIISSLEKKIGKDPRFHGKKIKPHKGIVMNGDFQEPEEFIKTTAYDVYLVSGGIQSKFWMHAMAKKYNKVILDIGHAMTRCWGRGY